MGIKGAILGDIIGSAWEFNPCKNPYTCVLFNSRTKFTDDTILSCATKFALDSGMTYERAYRLFSDRYVFTDNGMFGRNMHKWIFGDTTFRQSIGNGSAMRVSYIGQYFDDLDVIQKEAELSAKVTHDTEDGIKGAVVTATCMWMARNGKTKKDIYDYICSEYQEYADWDLKRYQKEYKHTELCKDAIHLAGLAFYLSDDFESCMRHIISVPCDADTICAIAGAFAEEYYGDTGFSDELIENYLDNFLWQVLCR